MKIQYFPDTDTLYIEFGDRPVVETHELDPDTLFDVDAEGMVCAITVEHASQKADLGRFTVEGLAA
jgi:uncharacterized protein YuzE